MANIALVYKFRSDAGTLSEGNWYSEFYLDNLQRMPLSKVARSKGVTLADTKIGLTMNPVRPAQVFALCRHDFPQDAKVRLISSTESMEYLNNTDLDFNFLVSNPPVAGVSVVRAGTSTRITSAGLVAAVSADTARIDFNPTTLLPRGINIEPSRTNSLLYSADLSNAAWTKTGLNAFGAGSIADTVLSTDPAGTNLADFIQESNANSEHGVTQALASLAANADYTFSYLVKAQGRDKVRLQITDTTANTNFVQADFDLANCLVTTTAVGGNGVANTDHCKITRFQNGYFRVELSGKPNTAANTGLTVKLGLLDGSGAISYAGDSTSGIIAWGGQVEAGIDTTSYVGTTSAAVTRAADAVTVTAAAGEYTRTITRDTSEADDAFTSAGTFPLTASGTDYWVRSIELVPSYKYDSGWKKAWPAITPYTLQEWEDDNWYTGGLLPEERVGYPINYIHVMPTPQYAGYWLCLIDAQNGNTITFEDNDVEVLASDNSINSGISGFYDFAEGQTVVVSGFTNPENNGTFTIASRTDDKIIFAEDVLVDEAPGNTILMSTGNVNIGRFILGPMLQTRHNMVYGSGLRYDPKSVTNESKNGTVYTRNYSNVREFDFALDMMDKSEAIGGVLDLQLRKGDFGDVLVIGDPEDPYIYATAFLAKMKELSAIENTDFDAQSTAFRVRETK